MWSHDFSWKYFLFRNFFLKIPTSTQAIKFKFGRNQFGKKTMLNIQMRIRFYKNSREQIDEMIYQRVSPMQVSTEHYIRKSVNSMQ